MEFTAQMQDELSQALDASRVKHRDAPGGRSFSYIEGHDAINTANRIFGFDGWSLSGCVIDYLPNAGDFGAYRATTTIIVHFEPPVSRVGEGVGIVLPLRGTGKPTAESHEMAIKGAATDALKRAFRTFGEQFGNGLYDRENVLHQAAPVRAGQWGSTERTAPTPPWGSPVEDRSSSPGRISDKQVQYATTLAGKAGMDEDAFDRFVGQEYAKDLVDLTRVEASALIDKLLAMRQAEIV